MADLRIPRQSLTPTPPTSVRPAVRAAQQAFFQAASAGEQVGAARTAQTPPSAAPPAKTNETEPQRPMRPGSLLDIKV